MTAAIALCALSVNAAEPVLKEVYADDFLIESAINRWQFSDSSNQDLPIISKHFNTITAENAADVSQSRAAGDSRWNPYPDGLPDEVQEQLADRYTDMFKLLLKYRDSVTRVTFWGVTDQTSWLNNFPIRGRTDYPLLFGRDRKPKPAYHAVVNLRAQNVEQSPE